MKDKLQIAQNICQAIFWLALTYVLLTIDIKVEINEEPNHIHLNLIGLEKKVEALSEIQGEMLQAQGYILQALIEEETKQENQTTNMHWFKFETPL